MDGSISHGKLFGWGLTALIGIGAIIATNLSTTTAVTSGGSSSRMEGMENRLVSIEDKLTKLLVVSALMTKDGKINTELRDLMIEAAKTNTETIAVMTELIDNNTAAIESLTGTCKLRRGVVKDAELSIDVGIGDETLFLLRPSDSPIPFSIYQD